MVSPRIGDEVPHHKEVRTESHVGDDGELIVNTLLHVSPERIAIAAPSTFHGQGAKVLRGALLVVLAPELIGNRKLR